MFIIFLSVLIYIYCILYRVYWREDIIMNTKDLTLFTQPKHSLASLSTNIYR